MFKRLTTPILVVWIMIAQNNGGFSVFPMPTQEVCEEKITWVVKQGAKAATCFEGEDPIYTTDPNLTTNRRENRGDRRKRQNR